MSTEYIFLGSNICFLFEKVWEDKRKMEKGVFKIPEYISTIKFKNLLNFQDILCGFIISDFEPFRNISIKRLSHKLSSRIGEQKDTFLFSCIRLALHLDNSIL